MCTPVTTFNDEINQGFVREEEICALARMDINELLLNHLSANQLMRVLEYTKAVAFDPQHNG